VYFLRVLPYLHLSFFFSLKVKFKKDFYVYLLGFLFAESVGLTTGGIIRYDNWYLPKHKKAAFYKTAFFLLHSINYLY